MNEKSDELVNELVSACIAFGRGQLPDWQTRIEVARVALREYITEIQSRIIDAMAERTVLLIESGNTIGRMESRIAELEAEIERFTVHSDIERQDNKSSNDTQTQTIVYGKEREE